MGKKDKKSAICPKCNLDCHDTESLIRHTEWVHKEVKLMTQNHIDGKTIKFEQPTVDPHFHPSPTKLVRFSDGKVIPMNRKLRRRNHIYGK